MMWLSRFMKPADIRHAGLLVAGVLAMLVVGLMLVPGMGEYSLWHDEVQVVLAAQNIHTVFDLFQIDAFPARIVHPPLTFALLRIWMTLVGQTDVALRALSTLGSLLTAALIYRVTVDLSRQPAAGFAAAAIFGNMGFARYYIHEVQSYGFLLTGTALLLFFYYRWWTLRRRRYAIGLAVALLLMVYTYYTSIYLILALTVHVLVTGRRQLWRWIKVSTVASLGYIPWLPAFVWTMILYPYSAAPTNIARSTSTSWAGLGFVFRVLLYNGWPYYAVFFGLAGLALAWHWCRSCRSTKFQLLRKAGFLFIVGAGGLGLPMLGNRFVQIFTPHRVIYLLVVFAIFLGYGFSLLPARGRWLGLGVFFILTFNQPLPAMMSGNWFYRQAMEAVAQRVQPGDGVYIDFGDTLENLPLRYYSEQFLPRGVPYHTPDEPTPALLNSYLPLQRIWVLRRQKAAEPALWREPSMQLKRLTETEQFTLAYFQIVLYSAPAGRPTPSLAHSNPASLSLPQRFEGQIELARYEVDKLEVLPGDRITVNLDWKAVQPLPQDWAIYLHLVQADYVTVHSQGDGSPKYLGTELSTLYWPVGAMIYDQQQLTVAENTPPGVYYLRLGIYARDTGQRLLVEPGDGVSANDGLVVAKIQVH
jgi:hypothetical protein